MKFLHIADLHIGKRLFDYSLLEDQKEILNDIVNIAKDENVNAVLIAGDVYQNTTPSSEAMTVVSEFLASLVDAGLKIFIISGNHDSDQKISYYSQLIKGSGVYVSEKFEGILQTIKLKDEYGPINIHLLPFIKPVHVRKWYKDEEIGSSEEAVSRVLANSEVDKAARNVLVCHQFVTGASLSGDEEYVGTLDSVSAGVFADFDYVALGHIHRAQRMGRDEVRFAGSPLKYSLSEVNHKKSVTIVDMHEKGSIEIKEIPLTPKHDMREVSGSFADIMDMPVSLDYVHVTVTDEIVPPDACITATTVFPNMIKFSIKNSKTSEDFDMTGAENIENKSTMELFCDFYRLQNNDVEPSEEHLKVLEAILAEMEKDDR